MRNAVGILFVGCVFLTTQPASAKPADDDDSAEEDRPAKKKRSSPFGRTRSEGSLEEGTDRKSKAAAKAAAKAKKAKPARRAKPTPVDEDIIVIEDNEPAARPAPANKTSKPAVAKSKPITKGAIDDEELVVVDDAEDDAAPAPTKKSPHGTVATTDDASAVDADDPTPARVTKTAAAKPRTTRFYFRAGGFKQSSKLGATEFSLQTDLPVDTSNLGAGSGVEMEQSQIPVGVIIGYVLPVLNRRLSLETVLGFPTKSKFKATGALANESLAPTFMGMQTGIEPLGPDIGEATFAPPMVTSVYRIADLGPVTPIAGLGVMLLMARGAKITNPVLNEAGDPKLSFTPSPGLVLQTGAEVRLWKRVAARLDIKYVVGMKVKARIDDIAVTPKAIPALGSIEVGDAVMSAKVTPLVVTAGVGADF